MAFDKDVASRELKKRCIKWHYILLLTLFWIAIWLINAPDGRLQVVTEKYCYENISGSMTTVTPSFTQGREITQSFSVPHDGLKRIRLLLATYQRTNNCSFSIAVKDESGTPIYQEVVHAAQLKDNAYYNIDFPLQENSKEKMYTLQILGIDGQEENSPTIWGGPSIQYPPVCVDGYEEDYSLTMQLGFGNGTIFALCYGILIVLSYIVTLWMAWNQRKLESIFIAVCLIGVLFVFFNPFRHALDEDTHFFKSYSISQLKFVEEKVEGQVGNYLSESLSEFVSYRNFSLNTNRQLLTQFFSEDENFYVNGYAASIIPMHHCIAALGILLADILGLSIGWTIWAGRLANYLFHVVICYLAIKNTKYYKSVFFTISCLPAILWMAGSYSTDPVLLATSLLFVSLCFKYRYSDGYKLITKMDACLILLSGMSMISVKSFIYSPLALCFFLIPKECFQKRIRSKMIVAAIMIVVIMVIWQFALMKEFLSSGDARGGDTDMKRQLLYMIQNPVEAIRTFLNYFRTTVLTHLTGTHAPQQYTVVSGLFSIGCIFSSAIATDKYLLEAKERKKTNLLFSAIFIIISLLAVTSMYLRFTPVGLSQINGVQTRYFFPALVMLMTVIANNGSRNDNKEHNMNLAFGILIFLLIQLTQQLMGVFS